MNEPLTVSVARAAELTSLSKWSIYDLVMKGQIRARRHGRRVLVEYDSLREYVDSLEEAAA